MRKLSIGSGLIFLCVVGPSLALSGEITLSVDQMDFCAAIKDRAPVTVADTFPADIFSIYCYTRVLGAHDTTAVVHSWYRDSTKVAEVELAVKSPVWRTWSSKKMIPEWRGEWKVEVTAPDGSVIASKSFFLE